jgi:hypothetical protein
MKQCVGAQSNPSAITILYARKIFVDKNIMQQLCYRRALSLRSMKRRCWGLVLKCYELRTRQHKMLNDTVLRP